MFKTLYERIAAYARRREYTEKIHHCQVNPTLEKIRYLLASRVPVWLDLGAGTHAYSNFTGLDIDPAADICCDLTKGIPFPTESVEKIRSDHFFEHLTYKECMFVLGECKRVLKNEGSIDITVPCFDVYLAAYLNNDDALLSKEIFDIPEDHRAILRTSFDKIMWVLVRNGEHKSFYDKTSFIAKLHDAGFIRIETRTHDPQIDRAQRFSSLYVRAYK